MSRNKTYRHKTKVLVIPEKSTGKTHRIHTGQCLITSKKFNNLQLTLTSPMNKRLFLFICPVNKLSNFSFGLSIINSYLLVCFYSICFILTNTIYK